MKSPGGIAIGNSPDEMTVYLQREIDKYAKVIKASGAQAD